MAEPVLIYRTAGETITVVDVVVAPPPPPPPPTITSLTATPPTLPAGGGNVTINWATTDAKSVQLDGVAVPGSLITKAVTATQTFKLVVTGDTSPPAQTQVTVIVAGVVTPPPPGETITVDAATKYQTLARGCWEAHARGWQVNKLTNAYDPTWKQRAPAVMQTLAALGVNRLQLPLRTGWINPVDHWTQFVTGTLSYTEWKAHNYETEGSSIYWSEFDFYCDTMIAPMAAEMSVRGEKLYVNMGIVDFNTPGFLKVVRINTDPNLYASFVLACFDRLKTKYGITAEALEISNEPENTLWTGAQMGAALVAAKAKLEAAGYTGLNYISPSASSASHTQHYADPLLAVPGAAQALTTLSYHRYDSPSTAVVAALDAYAKARGLKADMSEWIDAKVDHLLTDLTVGNVSSWQKWGVAIAKNQASANPQAFYLIDDGTTIKPALNTAMMTAIMRFVRGGAVRVQATNVGAPRTVVAFVNADGKQVVAVKSAAFTLITAKGLKPGTYGVHNVGPNDIAGDGDDVVVAADGIATYTVGTGMTTLYGKGGPVVPPPPGALAVTIDFGAGSVARYDSTRAVDQGRFVGEFVQQDCALDVDSAFPDWRVYFRHDVAVANARDEVVFEYGRTTAVYGTAKSVPNHMTPYTVTITKDGATLYTVTVQRHFGYTRWRWASSERSVVRTPTQLKARGWLPNFGPGGLFGAQPSKVAIPWPGPMLSPGDAINPATGKKYGGFSPVMGAAGDNWQIGHLTTAAVEYILHETPESLRTVRTEGEWCGNWPIHMRDDATGAPLDVRGQKLRTKGNGGTINDPPSFPAGTPLPPGFVYLDESHRYPCYVLPWLLTEDPYYGEGLFFGANRHVLMAQFHRTQNNLQGMVYPGTQRAYAWGIRDLFYAARSAPATVPSWLLPKSYWQSCVDDSKTYALKFVNSPARVHALFKTWTRSDADPSWQTAFLNAAVGIGVSLGFADWLPVFQWGVDKHIQQTNGTSGWPRQYPAPYYSIPDKATVWGTPTNILPLSSDATACLSWADYWAYYKSGSPDPTGVGRSDTSGVTVDESTWPDDHTIMHPQSGPSYILHLRAALALAVTYGIPGAQASYDYIQSELPALMAKFRTVGNFPFSIDP